MHPVQPGGSSQCGCLHLLLCRLLALFLPSVQTCLFQAPVNPAGLPIPPPTLCFPARPGCSSAQAAARCPAQPGLFSEPLQGGHTLTCLLATGGGGSHQRPPAFIYLSIYLGLCKNKTNKQKKGKLSAPLKGLCN